MAKTVVIKGRMASEDINSYLVSVQNTVDMENGSHVKVGSAIAGSPSTYSCTAPADVTKDLVYIVESPVIIEINGLRVDLEDPTLFTNPANRPARARMLKVGDTLTISVDGFSTAPTVGKYAVPANGAYKLAPAVDLTGGTTLAYQVLSSDNITVGQGKVACYKLQVVKAL